jgi:hypothetical protein
MGTVFGSAIRASDSKDSQIWVNWEPEFLNRIISGRRAGLSRPVASAAKMVLGHALELIGTVCDSRSASR